MKLVAQGFTPPAVIQADEIEELLFDLAARSAAANTRRVYEGAIRRLHAWLAGRPLTDETLARYMAERHAAGLAPASVAMTVAALRRAARLRKSPSPVGPISEMVLRGIRNTGWDRGRGQAMGLRYEEFLQVLARACERRQYADGRRESAGRAEYRGRADAAITSMLWMAAMRRSEVAEARWADVKPGSQPGRLLVWIPRSKTDQTGARADARMLKSAGSQAFERWREIARHEGPRIFALGEHSIGRRFADACEAAGIGRRSAHAGRVGLATHLTERGASQTAVQLAGGWQSGDMVARYSKGAHVERGAVEEFL